MTTTHDERVKQIAEVVRRFTQSSEFVSNRAATAIVALFPDRDAIWREELWSRATRLEADAAIYAKRQDWPRRNERAHAASELRSLADKMTVQGSGPAPSNGGSVSGDATVKDIERLLALAVEEHEKKDWSIEAETRVKTLRVCLECARANSTPPGFVLVPREATKSAELLCGGLFLLREAINASDPRSELLQRAQEELDNANKLRLALSAAPSPANEEK